MQFFSRRGRGLAGDRALSHRPAVLGAGSQARRVSAGAGRRRAHASEDEGLGVVARGRSRSDGSAGGVARCGGGGSGAASAVLRSTPDERSECRGLSGPLFPALRPGRGLSGPLFPGCKPGFLSIRNGTLHTSRAACFTSSPAAASLTRPLPCPPAFRRCAPRWFCTHNHNSGAVSGSLSLSPRPTRAYSLRIPEECERGGAGLVPAEQGEREREERRSAKCGRAPRRCRIRGTGGPPPLACCGECPCCVLARTPPVRHGGSAGRDSAGVRGAAPGIRGRSERSVSVLRCGVGLSGGAWPRGERS